MKKRGTKYSAEDIRRTRIISFLFAIISAGVLLGTLIFKERDSSDFLSDYLCQGFVAAGGSQSAMDAFSISLSWTSFFVVSMFMLGFCSISQPLEFLLLFYRGIAIGMSLSYIYSYYGVKGALSAIFTVIPYAIITSVIMVFAAREAIRMSNLYIFWLVGRVHEDDNNAQLKLYIIRFAVLMFFVLLASVIDCTISYLLADKLVF